MRSWEWNPTLIELLFVKSVFSLPVLFPCCLTPFLPFPSLLFYHHSLYPQLHNSFTDIRLKQQQLVISHQEWPYQTLTRSVRKYCFVVYSILIFRSTLRYSLSLFICNLCGFCSVNLEVKSNEDPITLLGLLVDEIQS